MFTVQEYDKNVRATARELATLSGTAEIRAWFAARGRPLDDSDNAYAAAFGTLQAVTQELLSRG